MKKMKKFLAMFLAMAMVLGMSMTTFAAGVPKEDNSMKITINGIDESLKGKVTYKAYQIIDATYDNGFTGYKWAPGTTLAGQKVEFTKVDNKDVVTGLTSSMIIDLAKDPSGLTAYGTDGIFDPANDELTVGTWMIIATVSGSTVRFNPMIASVYYTTGGSDDTMDSDPVEAGDKWKLETTNAYAKQTDGSEITKEVKAEDQFAQVGTEVEFTITGMIPAYIGDYDSVIYTITDTVVNGLKYEDNMSSSDITLTVGNDIITNLDGVATFTTGKTDEKDTFTLEFNPAYILGLNKKTDEERAVKVVYKATITEDAIQAVGENEVTLTYTTDPGEDDDGKPYTGTDKDTEYVYTLSFDGILQKVKKENGESVELKDAVFGLFSDEGCTNPVTDENNKNITYSTVDSDKANIKFAGLDKITYYLKEVEAPEGFTLNNNVYKIEFEATVPDNGKLETYTVKVTNLTDNTDLTNLNDGVTITYGSAYNSGDNENPFGGEIVNTSLASLPSTGGIGTTIFTVGGCAIMIIAAGLYFASRRRAAK